MFRTVLICKKRKTPRTPESNEEYIDMAYNPKTESVISWSKGTFPQASSETQPHYVSPRQITTTLAPGKESEELDEKAEPMYEEMEKYMWITKGKRCSCRPILWTCIHWHNFLCTILHETERKSMHSLNKLNVFSIPALFFQCIMYMLIIECLHFQFEQFIASKKFTFVQIETIPPSLVCVCFEYDNSCWVYC